MFLDRDLGISSSLHFFHAEEAVETLEIRS